MKAQEVRGLSVYELEQQLRDLRQELYNLRFQRAARQLSNPSRIRRVKRDIARILTILRERELEPVETE